MWNDEKPDLKAVDAKMARDDGGYAFPVPMVYDGTYTETVNERGMSLRDYFAAAVLPAVYAASVARGDELQETIVDEAYEIADRMLDARRTR